MQTLHIDLPENPTIQECQQGLESIRDAFLQLDRRDSNYEDNYRELRTQQDILQAAISADEWSKPRQEHHGSNGPIAATMDISGTGNGGGQGEILPGRPSSLDDWARTVAKNMYNPETRAIASGEIHVPDVISRKVVEIPRNPTRLIDLIVNRKKVTENTYTYWQQSVGTNNAAIVVDSQPKPESPATVVPVSDQLRTVANVSENIPNRYFEDSGGSGLERFVGKFLYENVVDATENLFMNGTGIDPQIAGLMVNPDITQQAFTVDMLTSLRTARKTLQDLSVRPNYYVMSTADAMTLDLLTSTTDEFLINKDKGFSNIFGSAGLIVTKSCPVGWAFVGDWTNWQLVYRDNIKLTQDPYTRMKWNETYMLAEWRANHAVLYPPAICRVDLTV